MMRGREIIQDTGQLEKLNRDYRTRRSFKKNKKTKKHVKSRKETDIDDDIKSKTNVEITSNKRVKKKGAVLI